MDGTSIELLRSSASVATRFLKALANRNRLLILCHLVDGEKSVSELERAIGLRQPTLSQQLARLRIGGLVTTRRDAKMIYYSIADRDIHAVLRMLYEKYCEPGVAARKPRATAARNGR